MARPFVKWAGGKTQLLPILLEVLPEMAETYYEPFLGGGAVYFALADRGRFHQASLNDFSSELIGAYKAVRDEPEKVIDLLRDMPFDRDFYENMRVRLPDRPAERAARVIYLNKSCFNGLFRVNQSGEFNAAFGAFAKAPRILDAPNLRDCSHVLQYRAALYSGDFVDAVAGARDGDVVYFDPPYVPLNATASFTSYTRDGFTLDDQKRLSICFTGLTRKGVRCVLSNSDVDIVRNMYRNFNIHVIPVRRPINSVGSARGSFQEVLIFNFDDPDRGNKLARITEDMASRRERQQVQVEPLECQDAFNLAMELGTSPES